MDSLTSAARNATQDMEFMFFSTRAMYRVGRSHWKKWSDKVLARLAAAQSTSGPNRGSWEPVGGGSGQRSRVAATALAVLALESRYCYSRLTH